MGKFTLYKLPLKGMPEGEHEYEFALDKTFFDNMECEGIHGSTLKAHVMVTYKHDLYDIKMDVQGQLILTCDRCLDELPWDVDAHYEVTVKYGDDYNEDDDQLTIPYEDATLNIAYMLKDTAVLAIPMKHVHPMGKCNRAMTAKLRQCRVKDADDEDAELEEELIDEMEQMQAQDGPEAES